MGLTLEVEPGYAPATRAPLEELEYACEANSF